VFTLEKLAFMIQVSDVTPGPLVGVEVCSSYLEVKNISMLMKIT
jgi:hypothetical protein